MFNTRNLLLVLALGFALNGCGGNSTSQAQVEGKRASHGMKQSASPYAAAVQELYVAYFGRPADPAGLANFEGALAAAGAPTDIQGLTSAYSTNRAVQSLIDSFGTSKESQTLYGSGSTQDFVKAIFNNVLGRAPQTAGLDYWTNAIDSGSLSKGDAALAIMDGALTNTSAQGLIDAQLVNNRLAAAAAFTAEVANAGATDVYSGAPAAASARAMLAQVDSATSSATYSAAVDATIYSLLQSTPGISLVAGNSVPAVPLTGATGIVADAGANLYVADMIADVIDKIAPDGTMTTLAGSFGPGSADGAGSSAGFYFPQGLAIDSEGNLYVADTNNNTIRKVTPDGVVSTVAGQAGAPGASDGSGQNARFFNPKSVAVDAAGNLYVADTRNEIIRKITPGGMVSTIAGQSGICAYADGAGTAAQFCHPVAIVVDGTGNLYIADLGNYAIRKVSPDGTVSTLAGSLGSGFRDGTGTMALFCSPWSLAFDKAGNLLVSDRDCVYTSGNALIRKVSLSGVVTTIAGSGSMVFADQIGALNLPVSLQALAVDGSGNIFATDFNANSIWKVSESGEMSTFVSSYGLTGATDGTGLVAGFAGPSGIVADASGNLYVADKYNDSIRKITPTGQVVTLAGTSGQAGQNPDQDGTGAAASFNEPVGVAIDDSGNLYVMDSFSGLIRLVSPSGVATTPAIYGAVTRVATMGTGIARDKVGNLYVCDSYNNVILKISQGAMTVLAGKSGTSGSADGAGSAASFSKPSGLAVDGAGNVYVADTNNNTIRKIDGNGNVTTVGGLAGSFGFVDGRGGVARLHSPQGLAFDPAGNLYIADTSNNAIRKMNLSGYISTVAGSASATNTVFGSLPGAIHRPQYLTVVGNNTLYVTSDNAVLRVQLP